MAQFLFSLVIKFVFCNKTAKSLKLLVIGKFCILLFLLVNFNSFNFSSWLFIILCIKEKISKKLA